MSGIRGTITLMGSGEMAESMRRVHHSILSSIAGRVRAVFLDTPAGFQLNADEISARAVEYFQHRLSIPLAVASYKSNQITEAEAELALIKLRNAHYIFGGPGSPTYLINQLRGTEVLQTLRDRFAAGAHLVFASAAAITMGRFALPVYEIYKVGEEPHWVEGLNFLNELDLDVVVIPHWNNAEGGTHDTRFCYLGEPRLEYLEARLPDSSVILGIDEHTACIFNPGLGKCDVMGIGQATIRYRGRERVHLSGAAFMLEELRPQAFRGEAMDSSPEPVLPKQRGMEQTPARAEAQLDRQIRLTEAALTDPATRSWGAVSALAVFLELARTVEAARETGVEPRRAAEADAILKQMVATWSGSESASEEVNSLIDLLASVRSELRGVREWELADKIRQGLEQRGIVLEDGREKTTWRRAKK